MEISKARITQDVNRMLIPTTKVDKDIFDEYVRMYNDKYERGEIQRGFILTPSHGISIKRCNLRKNLNTYEVFQTKSMHELMVIEPEGMFRLQWWHGAPKEFLKEKLSGRKCYIILKRELEKDGVDISKLYIQNGEEIKEQMPSPLIGVTKKTFYGVTFDNCHHVDINSAYPHFISKYHPELRPTIERMYDQRKNNPHYKLILNASYGWFQSKFFAYKMADASKYALEQTILTLQKLAAKIEKEGGMIIAYNVDGIWYRRETPLKLTKKGLGGIKTDHKYCKLRYKSNGVYEYIEKGKYYPVVRGKFKYEEEVDKKDWKWGDIYKSGAIGYKITDEYGIAEEIEIKE